MSFFTNIRADRLVTEIRSSNDPTGAATQKAVARLKDVGPGAIEAVLAALPDADKGSTMAFVEVLTGLVSQKTFPQFMRGLVEGSPRVVSGISWALTSSRNYPPHMLLEALTTPGISKPTVPEVIAAQKTRFGVRELLAAAYTQEPNEKAALFRVIGEIADKESIPELIGRVQGKDPIARVHIINTLARFNTPEVQTALQGLLKDPNKLIRGATLSALQRMNGPIDIERVCALLRDPEIDVLNRAIDVVIKANHPETIRYLIEVLKDENENARRAAVEVLNEIGNAKSVKYLLEALKDSDWWVSERAVDALAEIGSKRALPRLLEMLQAPANGKAMPIVVRALGKLGDSKLVDTLLPLIGRPEREIRIEAIQALSRVADEARAGQVREELQAQVLSPDQTISRMAALAVSELDNRIAGVTALPAGATPTPTQAGVRPPQLAPPEAARTLLISDQALAQATKTAEAAARLDIQTLKPGDIIEGRYKYIDRIGRGAFGTVLLMEDTVVDERLILKFLNPNVSQDEEVMKRFVHELRYSRKITHKNVIRIYDFLYIQGLYAISMEYFPSHTLGSEVVNDKPIALQRALQFGIDMCTGMTVAHQVGIVHRDLKPANVLINQDGLLKIVDFGVAAAHREGDTQLTKTGSVIGSPKYMAPEQILGKKVDERADIYSLGVILYEMVAGVPPYSRGDHMSVMYQHVQGKARPPIDINKDLPLELNNLVMKCMALDKAKRAQSMDELRLSLEKFL